MILNADAVNTSGIISNENLFGVSDGVADLNLSGVSEGLIDTDYANISGELGMRRVKEAGVDGDGEY